MNERLDEAERPNLPPDEPPAPRRRRGSRMVVAIAVVLALIALLAWTRHRLRTYMTVESTNNPAVLEARKRASLRVDAQPSAPSDGVVGIAPRRVVEFAPGSAVVNADELAALQQMIDQAHERAEPYRVAVHGYADRATNHDAAAWVPADVALAAARARALSDTVRALGEGGCIVRVALGNIPDDAPPERTDADGQHWLARGLVVLEKPGTQYAPINGVDVENDCVAETVL